MPFEFAASLRQQGRTSASPPVSPLPGSISLDIHNSAGLGKKIWPSKPRCEPPGQSAKQDVRLSVPERANRAAWPGSKDGLPSRAKHRAMYAMFG